MEKLLPPYRIDIDTIGSVLFIVFDETVTADLFFANCFDIQQILEEGTYRGVLFNSLYIDFSKTTWFDTLAMCYVLMFADCAQQRHTLTIRFYFSEVQGHSHLVFRAFLSDNGFLSQMERIGEIYNFDVIPEIQYSQVHKCIWPLQIFHQADEIEDSIDLIKKQLNNELSNTLNAYELENLVSKVTYFLQETLDNAYKHGYEQICTVNNNSHSGNSPCSLLIKRVKSSDTLDLKAYGTKYTEHTPYINISLFEEKQEYIEIYVADIGIGLRRSFLSDPDGKDANITDENILEYILSDGQRSQKIITPANSTRYGGLYDIMSLFQGDGDKLGFKCDSRWFFDKIPQRINNLIPQGQYHGLSHGFAIIGNISWNKRHSDDHPFKNQILETMTQYKDNLYLNKNPWMRLGYRGGIQILDGRFSGEVSKNEGANICVLFPAKYLEEKKIVSSIICDKLIISGIHESEFKRYRSILETLNINRIRPTFQQAIVITNTLFPYVFLKRDDRIVFSPEATCQYIQSAVSNTISNSYISFRLWKKVYDSEQLWSHLADNNRLGYINTSIQWGSQTLRGYLDFSQLCLISECRNLCIEQLIGFQLCCSNVYFCSLDRFTEEICEQANHLMDNSKDGEIIWIGSIFVSGTSERKLSSTQTGKNVFYFFKHADCREDSRKTCTLFEWATQAFRVNSWFPPKNYQGKKYSRVGNSSFIAEGGSDYWASRHYACWEQSYYLQQKDTYKLLQRQFGARPALLKMGHFDATDHHDLFEIKTDALVDSDIMSSQILRGRSVSSFDFLLLEFSRALGVSTEEGPNGANTKQWQVVQKKIGGRRKYSTHGQGILVYLDDYQTSKIIETMKQKLPSELQQRIVPIIPIEKNYTSSTLLISPLLLDALEQKIQSILDYNEMHFNQRTIDVTIFIATAFTTRLQEEIKHILFRMGVSHVRTLSVFDRQRLPYGSCPADNNISYARLDLPAIGFFNTCPICRVLNTLRILQEQLQDEMLIDRARQIIDRWVTVKSSDNHYKSGISISRMELPKDIQQALHMYENVYGQGEVCLNTNLGIALFAIENTVISLSLDFLNRCLESAELDVSVKLLLISSHLLTFSEFQLSEKYFCRLLDQLCDLLEEQTLVTEFTGLAVVAVCAQPPIFQQYSQQHMAKRFRSGHASANNDSLLLKLALYQTLQQNKETDVEYLRELHCYLKNGKTALALIYDLFLYTETEYKQSHRQAFAQIRHSNVRKRDETYQSALNYVHKLESIYSSDLVRDFFHDPSQYTAKRESILQQLRCLEESLTPIESVDHQKLQYALVELLDTVQELNKGLYLRAEKAVGNKDIAAWLTYCEICAKKRVQVDGCGTILQIINGYTGNNQSDVYPWFFAYSDVTEEVINLIVDMIQMCSSRLRNFLQNSEDQEKAYDGIIMVRFRDEYVELSFYNATSNKKSIEEIRRIKRSKENRPSVIPFRQFERIISHSSDRCGVCCFEWDYIDEQCRNCLADGKSLGNSEHLYRATLRIPYIDMGSSFNYA